MSNILDSENCTEVLIGGKMCYYKIKKLLLFCFLSSSYNLAGALVEQKVVEVSIADAEHIPRDGEYGQ